MEIAKKETFFKHLCSATFCVIVLLSNIISAKMVKLPFTADFFIPAGLLTYPLAFLLSNLVTELYGKGEARKMIYLALGMNLLGFGIIELTLILPGDLSEGQRAFETTMRLGGLRIFSSLTAYLLSQLVDIQLYAFIKKRTGSRFLWLRNNASLLISQMIDTIVIDLIFLYGGLGMELREVLPIMAFSYGYKMMFSLGNTPLLYLLVFFMRQKKKFIPTNE